MTQAPHPVIDRVIDGRYQVTSTLATGGMATVYRAHDLRLDRPVALKLMRSDLARDQAFVQRFVNEARSAARLQHPHVVQVYDQGEDGDLVYLAMELIEGRNLRDVITADAPLSTREALALVIPVVEALEQAHRQHLVHRDIKPENVLLGGPRGKTVKVADFGLARAITAASPQATSEMLWGTAAYLAPEQFEHGRSDARTDVYAVGLLLFELLSGQKAFPGNDPMRVAYEHVHGGVPRVRDLVPTVPEPVDELITRASATEPDDRPQDGRELLTALRRLATDLTDAQLDARPPRSPAQTTEIPVAPAPQDPNATQVVESEPDATQLMRPAGAEQTRAIPVAMGSASGGHYARVTGNRPARRPPEPPAARTATPPVRRRRKALAWVLAVLLILGAAGGGYAYWYQTAGPAVHSPMPAVVDLPEAEAIRLMEEAQLVPDISYAYSEEIDEGIVMSANRGIGASVRHGTEVEMVVSQGAERFAVPPLAGLTVDDARTALEAAQLTVGEQDQEHHDSVPAGQVLSSDPAPGEQVRRDTAVSLTISSGPAPVQLQDTTGMPWAQAQRQLMEQRLSVVVDPERIHHDEIPAGHVVRQEPSSGEVERGSTVTIIISDGPELVTVPAVVGRQFRTVEEELRQLGLDVVREDIRGGFFGTVREQSLEPGDEVPVGTEIVLGVV